MDWLLHPLAQVQPGSTADLINDLARTPLSQVVKFIAVLTLVRLACYPYLRNTAPHKRTGLYGFLKFINEVLDALIYAGAFVFLIIRPFALQTFQIPSGSMWPTLHVSDYIVANKAIYRYSDPKFGDIVVFRPPVEGANPDQIDEKGEVKVDFIKRLVGVPGDVIELRNGTLYRNGEKSDQQFRHYSHSTFGSSKFEAMSEDEIESIPWPSFKLVEHNGEIIPFNYTSHDANSAIVRGFGGQPEYSVAPRYEIDDPAVKEELIQQEPKAIPEGYYLMMGDNRNGSFDSRGWGLVPREAVIGRSEFIWWPPSRWQRTK